MNKNVIALAVAAAMAAPLAAQADVKVSGQLQAEVISLSGDGAVEGLYLDDAAENGKLGSGNAGALNFSASEDLGNGMKALAKYGFNIQADDAGHGNRDAYVGLSGGFGTVLAGRMSSPYKMSTVKWDPFLATAAQARGSNGMSGLHNSYVDNVVAYANKFGMAKVVAAISLDEAEGVDAADDTGTGVGGVAGDGICNGTETCNGKAVGNHAITASLNVPVGPVEIAVGYIDTSSMASENTYTNTAVKLGVKYTAGAITVAGHLETIDNETANNGTDIETYTFVTGSYAMGANTLSASYGMYDDETDTDGYMALGLKHAFSKKTSVHVVYRASDDDSAADRDTTALAVGMRVKF